jgi:hypothetical protein
MKKAFKALMALSSAIGAVVLAGGCLLAVSLAIAEIRDRLEKHEVVDDDFDDWNDEEDDSELFPEDSETAK